MILFINFHIRSPHLAQLLNVVHSLFKMASLKLFKVLIIIKVVVTSAYGQGWMCVNFAIGDNFCDDINNILDCDHDGGT